MHKKSGREGKFDEQYKTPWGNVLSVERISDGIMFYSTASHGGYYLSPSQNSNVPMVLKESTFLQQGLLGWYEEDCDWAIVVFCFKNHFDQTRYDKAILTLQKFHTEAWSQLEGTDESRPK